MPSLHVDDGKWWDTQVIVFRHDPVHTFADVTFHSDEMGHRISVGVPGDNELRALQLLHERLVLYGMFEVAGLVNTEIANRGGESRLS